MFDVATIKSNLYGAVGVRQPINPDYAIIDASNQASASGMFVNDNALAKVELFIDNTDYTEASDLQINAVLKSLQEASIVRVLNAVFNEVDYIDNQILFKNPLNYKNTETLESGFVGYRIRKGSEKNVSYRINSVDLTFSNTGTFTLLLFNARTGQVEQSKEITVASRHQTETLNWSCSGQNSEYYIGYISTATTLIPYKRDYRNSNLKSCYTNIYVNNVYVTGHTSDTVIFDLDDVNSSDNCFGLNLDIAEYYDYTDFITRNAHLFHYAIYLQYAINMIETYLTSIRSNKNERISKDIMMQAMAEIDGVDGDDSVIKKTGLKSMLFGEIKGLQKKINMLKKGLFGSKIKVITLC